MSFQIDNSTHFIYNWTFQKYSTLGFEAMLTHLFTFVSLLIASLILLWLIHFVVRRVLIKFTTEFTKRSKTKFDDYLLKNKVFANLARLIPLYIFASLIPVLFSGFPGGVVFTEKFVEVLLIINWTILIISVMKSIRDYLGDKESFRGKPLDSYLQVANIFLFFIAGILIFTTFTGQSPWAFLTAMGAASAVLMLVFKDTILGFVASIQVSTNDMVRVGDWIEMPKYGADGDVIEINLNTVKVQNWDKTITTVPTYYLITDSFKNWRGMQNSGGRRIKRALNIKISSIHYVSPEELKELKKIKLLQNYIDQRQEEIDAYNAEHFPDRTMPVNGRNMTNIGLFREYINQYVKIHPGIHKDMTIMVRQLSPTEHGLPIELYMFTADVRWVVYEGIMSDIFDHLLAAIKFFNLETFEAPASDDMRSIGKALIPKVLPN